MKSLAHFYTTELLHEFKMLANWLPINDIKPGDIGEFQDNAFVVKGNLTQNQVPFTVTESNYHGEINYASQGGSSISNKLSGTVLPTAKFLSELDAGFVVEFSKEYAIVVKTKNARVKRIENQIGIEPDLIKLYKKNILKKGRCVISEIIYADSATILISKSKDAKIEVKAKAKLGNDAIDIADADLGFKVAFNKDVEGEYLAQNGLILFYRVLAVNNPWFGDPGVVSKGGFRGADDDGKALKVMEVDFEMEPIPEPIP